MTIKTASILYLAFQLLKRYFLQLITGKHYGLHGPNYGPMREESKYVNFFSDAKIE